MADYTPLISRAVTALTENTGEARRGVYERARAALLAQLRGMNPPLPEELITRERVALEDAIRRVEADNAAPPMPADVARSLEEATPLAPAGASVAEPVSIGGAKAVHEAAAAAEHLGEATAEARRNAQDSMGQDSMGQDSLARDTSTQGRFEQDKIARDAPAPTPDIASARGPALGAALERPVDLGARRPGDSGPIRPRISVLSEDPEPPRRGAGLWIGVAVATILLVGGGLGYYYANFGWPAALTSGPPTTNAPPERPGQPAQPVDADRPKIADRVGDPAPASAPPAAPQPAPAQPVPPTAQPAPPTAQPPQPAPPSGPQPVVIAQRAALFEETPGAQQGTLMPGTVVWRTQTISVGPGQPPDLAVVGEVQIPERRAVVTLTFRRNLDQTLPATHTIEVVFNLPRDFQFGGVAEVPGVLTKPSEQARGVPLVGQSVRVTNGFFLVGLSAFDADRQANIQALRTRAFFDIPLRYDNGRRAIMTLEKGSTGERAFDEAMTAWGQ